MLEDVLKLREERFLMDELQSLKVQEMGFQFLPHAGDCLKDPEGKFPADDGCHLHDPLEALLQTVDASGDDPLDRIRDLKFRGLPGQGIAVSPPFNGAVLERVVS